MAEDVEEYNITITPTHSYLQVDHEDSYSSDKESSSSDEVNDVGRRVAHSNEDNDPEPDIETLQSLMEKIEDLLRKNPSARPESMIERVSAFYPQTELEHNDIRQNLTKLPKMAETRDCAATLIPILPSNGSALLPEQRIPLRTFRDNAEFLKFFRRGQMGMIYILRRRNAAGQLIRFIQNVGTMIVPGKTMHHGASGLTDSVSKGGRRFFILRAWSADIEGFLHYFALVRMLPRDLREGRVPRCARARGQDFRPVLRVPLQAYRAFDSRCLADQLRKMYLGAKRGNAPWLGKEDIWLKAVPVDMGKTEALSWFLAAQLPVSDWDRMRILNHVTTSMRLKMLLEIMGSLNVLRCERCRLVITELSDAFIMSPDGAVGSFVNGHGYNHDIVTVTRLQTELIPHPEPPSTDHCWFPGYAWTIMYCPNCFQHLGWRYDAVDPKLRPRHFFGIRRSAITWRSETHATI